MQIAMAGVNTNVQMHADIDSRAAAGAAVAAAAMNVEPTTPPPEHVHPPPANFEVMMQQQFMKFMQGMFAPMAATSPSSGATGSSQAAFSLHRGGGGVRLANVRLGERAPKRIDRLSNKTDKWREWVTHLLTAVRECDKSFADSLERFEKSDKVIEDTDLIPTLQQLSATL